MSGVIWRLLLYGGIVTLPVIVVTFIATASGSLLSEMGKNFALMAFVILTLQVVLAARIKWIERVCGFDILIRYHQYMAVFALGLLLFHPVLLAAGGGGWRLLIGLKLPWYIWLGKATLFFLILMIVVSRFQKKIHLSFETWRLSHDVFGPLILVMAFVHSLVASGDLHNHIGMTMLWTGLLLSAAALFVYHVIIRPQYLKRHSYIVADVQAETRNVWTIRLRPPEGEAVEDYHPGQFHFIKFYRDRDLPVEEHHWTISSSPTENGYVSSTIKALGDFTATIGETKVGDRAAVHGAFGRFSYSLHPNETDLVFLAGGIGITPLMSMLRHMKAMRDSRSVLLIYANKKPEDILFRDELEKIASGEYPRLKIVHVLSEADDDWPGETGFVDREKLERLCGEKPQEKTFYVCGPKPMAASIIADLKTMSVPDKNIRTEIFSFID